MRRWVAKIAVFLVCLILAAWPGLSPAQDSRPDSSLGLKLWQPGFVPIPYDTVLRSPVLELDGGLQKSTYQTPYYDLRNVFPQNRLFLDYRESSYYTPRMVSDKLTRIMNRPRADSFMPILPIAFLAARIAMQQIKIAPLITISPVDYLACADQIDILLNLWQSAPQTLDELYTGMNKKKNMTIQTLQSALEKLINHKLVKTRVRQNAPQWYFPAQSRRETRALLQESDIKLLSERQIQARTQLLKMLED